jgi:hypothetical protein
MVSVNTTYDGSDFITLPSFLPSLEYDPKYSIVYTIRSVKTGGERPWQ